MYNLNLAPTKLVWIGMLVSTVLFYVLQATSYVFIRENGIIVNATGAGISPLIAFAVGFLTYQIDVARHNSGIISIISCTIIAVFVLGLHLCSECLLVIANALF